MSNPVISFFRALLPGASPSGRIKKALTPSCSDMKLEESVRRQMAFLFDRFAASVVSNQYFPHAFGNAILVIDTKYIRLRVVRDRDEVRIDLAAIHGPTEWMDSALALAAIGAEQSNYVFSLNRAITSIARHMDPKFDALQEAYAPERYQAFKERMMEILELENQKAIERFNSIR